MGPPWDWTLSRGRGMKGLAPARPQWSGPRALYVQLSHLAGTCVEPRAGEPPAHSAGHGPHVGESPGSELGKHSGQSKQHVTPGGLGGGGHPPRARYPPRAPRGGGGGGGGGGVGRAAACGLPGNQGYGRAQGLRPADREAGDVALWVWGTRAQERKGGGDPASPPGRLSPALGEVTSAACQAGNRELPGEDHLGHQLSCLTGHRVICDR